jgi:hypothetical protein
MSINETIPLYQLLARKLQSRLVYEDDGTSEHSNLACEVEELVYQYMPAGNGVDLGTKIDMDFSDHTGLIFYVQFHHYNDDGTPSDWTSHSIAVVPSRSLTKEFDLTVSGEDRNGVLFWLYNTFYNALMAPIMISDVHTSEAIVLA